MKSSILSLLILGAISSQANAGETRIVEKHRIIESKIVEVKGCRLYFNKDYTVQYDDASYQRDYARLTGEKFDYKPSVGKFVLSVPMTIKKKVVVQNYLVEQKIRRNRVSSEKLVEGSMSEPTETTIVETLNLTEDLEETLQELGETPELTRTKARARLLDGQCTPLLNKVESK